MDKNMCPKCKKGKLEMVNDFYDNVYLMCTKCKFKKELYDK